MTKEQDSKERERLQKLVKLAKSRDANAFSLLYEMVYMDLYRMALYTLGDRDDAEDLVSETVLDAYVNIGSLRDETAFRGWIFRILSNKCKHKIRDYIHERNYRETELPEDMSSPSSAAEMENLLDRQDISNAFAVISPEERLIVTMVVYGGYNSREIASLLHKNQNTVRSKYKRALEKMQRWFNQ